MKKWLYLVLAFLLLAATVTGCAQETPVATEAPTESSTVAQEETPAATDDAEGEAGDVKTYTILTVRNNSIRPTDFFEEEGAIMRQLEEGAGINIEWDIRVLSDWNDQKALFLAAGNLPDAFLGNTCIRASDFADNKSYFVDLTDYITEENMPNFWAAMEKEPTLRSMCTSRDGRIYSLPKILPLRPEVCGDGTYINTAFLEALNMDMPTNIEELSEYLIAVGTQDPDGDGDPSNTYGITNCAGSVMGSDCRHILSCYGTMISREGNYMGLNSEGELQGSCQVDEVPLGQWRGGPGILHAGQFCFDLQGAARGRLPGGPGLWLDCGWSGWPERGRLHVLGGHRRI